MMKPMNDQKNDYSGKRIIDFNPQICGLNDDGILVFSPLDLMEGNNLYLPEGIRMPNGEISENILFDDWSFFVTLSRWQKGPITLYAGRNYAVNYYSWVMGVTKDYEKDNALYYPNVNYICLYDDVYEFNEIGEKTIRISSKNGILYCDDEVAFVPDRNTYAENLPLEPMHAMLPPRLIIPEVTPSSLSCSQSLSAIYPFAMPPRSRWVSGSVSVTVLLSM